VTIRVRHGASVCSSSTQQMGLYSRSTAWLRALKSQRKNGRGLAC
jgi:hypothetical protein